MIIQKVICDMCFVRDGSMNEAHVTRTLGLDKKQVQAEVCNDCDEQLKGMLAPFFDAGRRIPKAQKRIAEVASVEVEEAVEGFGCACGRSFPTERGLNRHMNYPPAADAEMEHAAA